MGRPRRFKSILTDEQDLHNNLHEIHMPPTHMGASSVSLAYSGASSVPPTHTGTTSVQSTNTTSRQSTRHGTTSAHSSHNGAHSESETTNFFDGPEDDVAHTSGTIRYSRKRDGYWREKFHVVDSRMKKYIMQRMGTRWKNIRNGLYKRFYKESLTMEENVRRRPSGVDPDQWIWFIQYNNDKKTQEMRERNAENRKKQAYTYAGGSKSIPRTKAEEELQRGTPMSRGEIWTIVHKGKDGNYVNDAARVIGEQIENIERQNGPSATISLDDSVARGLGKEHAGRVRGVGHGPTPTQVFGCSTHQCSSTSFTHQIQDDKMDEIKSELEAEKSKVRELESIVGVERSKRQKLESVMGFISKYFVKQGGDMPPELFAIVNAMLIFQRCS